jgi:hypothetical protein
MVIKINQNPNFRAMLTLDKIAIMYGEPMALLIQCCRVHFKTDSIENLNEKIEKFGDEKLAEVLKKAQLLSRLHRIRPVVYRVLLNANISAELKTALKNELHSITLKNFELAKETERIVKRLEAANVLAIPYKGVAFSKQFYGDISMRESSDIDLVINADQLDLIIKLMQEDGYKANGIEGLKRIKRESFIAHQKDFCFDLDKTFHVEFHWRNTHPNFCMKSPLDLFKNSQELEIEKSEHLRAVVLHHWITEGFEYLKTLIDIGQAISKEEKYLNLSAIRVNSLYGLDIAQRCNHELFGLIQNYIQHNPIVKKKARAIIGYNLNHNFRRNNSNRTLTLIRQYYTSFNNQFVFKESFGEKISFLFKFWTGLLLPKHKDYSMVGIHKSFGFLYFFIRAYRLLRRIIMNTTN